MITLENIILLSPILFMFIGSVLLYEHLRMNSSESKEEGNE